MKKQKSIAANLSPALGFDTFQLVFLQLPGLWYDILQLAYVLPRYHWMTIVD